MRRLASSHFDERIDERANPEIADLARDFNEMAVEIRALHRLMET
jgi:nitrate/nitrite-specific signal transduction histidine kinase